MRTSIRSVGLSALVLAFAVGCGSIGESPMADDVLPESATNASPDAGTVFDGGSVDTDGGAANTAASPTTHAIETSGEVPALGTESARVGFSPRGRWAFFVDEPASRVTFVDRRDGAVRTLREALYEGEAAGSGAQVLTGYDLSYVASHGLRFALGETRVFGRGADGRAMRVINLETARVEFEQRGELDALTLAPSGRAFAFRERGARNAVHLVSLDDTADHVVLATQSPVGTVRFLPNGWIVFTESAAPASTDVHVVDPSSPATPWVISVRASDEPIVDVSPTAEHLALRTGERTLALYRRGASTPHATFDAEVDALLWSANGASLAWSERGADDSPEVDRTVLHATDAATGRDVRFVGAGTCSIATETLTRFDGDELVTDGECNAGCPSNPSQSIEHVYDARTGAHRATHEGPVIEPYNDERDRTVSEMSELGGQGLEGESVEAVLLPGDERALLARGGSLELVTRATRRRIAALADSHDQTVTTLAIAPDASVATGIDARGVARIWDLASGSIVWASSSPAR